jgi:uncharacterized protein YciI
MRLDRRIFMIVMIANLFACASSEMEDKDQKVQISSTIEYDSILAKKYGADDYGMKPYVIAFLERGEANGLTEQETAELQQAHMENIGKMAEAGKLVLAGPFLDDGPLRGIYIFDVATVEEAEELTNTDPAIQVGVLKMDLKPWYGSAAVMGLNEVHNTITKPVNVD